MFNTYVPAGGNRSVRTPAWVGRKKGRGLIRILENVGERGEKRGRPNTRKGMETKRENGGGGNERYIRNRHLLFLLGAARAGKRDSPCSCRRAGGIPAWKGPLLGAAEARWSKRFFVCDEEQEEEEEEDAEGSGSGCRGVGKEEEPFV